MGGTSTGASRRAEQAAVQHRGGGGRRGVRGREAQPAGRADEHLHARVGGTGAAHHALDGDRRAVRDGDAGGRGDPVAAARAGRRARRAGRARASRRRARRTATCPGPSPRRAACPIRPLHRGECPDLGRGPPGARRSRSSTPVRRVRARCWPSAVFTATGGLSGEGAVGLPADHATRRHGPPVRASAGSRARRAGRPPSCHVVRRWPS